VKKQLSDLKDLNDLKISIESNNIVFLVPPTGASVPTVLGKEYEKKGLRCQFGRVYLSNIPTWEEIPLLKEQKNAIFARPKSPEDEKLELDEQKSILERVQKFSSQKGTPISRKTVVLDPLAGTADDNDDDIIPSKGSSAPPPVPRRPSDSKTTSGSTGSSENSEVNALEIPQRRRPSLEEVVPASYAATAANARENFENIVAKFHADSVYKMEFDFTDVSIDFVDFSSKDTRTATRENIFKADGLQFFARYQMQDASGNSTVEMVLVGLDELLLNLTVQQLYHSSQLVQALHRPVTTQEKPQSPSAKKPEEKSEKADGESGSSEKLEKTAGKLVEMINEDQVKSAFERLKGVVDNAEKYVDSHVDSNSIDDYVDEKYISSAGQYVRDLMSQVGGIMATSHIVLLVQINRVFFHVPLKAFDDLDHPIIYKKRIETEEARHQMSRVTSFGFEKIELGLQYHPERQIILFREKGLQTKDWHPSFSASAITVVPAPMGPKHPAKVFKLDTTGDFNFSFYADRDRTAGKKPFTDVYLQMRDFELFLQSEAEKQAVKAAEKSSTYNLDGAKQAYENAKENISAVKQEDLLNVATELKEKAENSMAVITGNYNTLANNYNQAKTGLPDLQQMIHDAMEYFESKREHFTQKFEQVSIVSL